MTSEEDTPSMVTDDLRPDHVSGSAMVIDGKDAQRPFDRYAAMCAVIEAERAYWRAVDDFKTALDALNALEKRG